MAQRIAVVIPCFAQARFLPDALGSLRDQTRPPDEIIVVDDGSPDDVPSAVGSHAGVTLLRQENRGLPGARNRGLEACTAEYVVFLDADDRLLPEALRIGADALGAAPGCAFVWGFNRGIDTRGAPTRRPPTSFQGRPSYGRLLERNIVGAPVGAMFRTAAVREVGGFDPDLPAVEDHGLYLQLARSHPFSCHEQLVAEYRHHGDNMSGDMHRMLQGALMLLDREERWLRSQDGPGPGGLDRRLLRAVRRGRRAAWRLYDGEPKLNDLRDQVRARSWRTALPLALALTVRYPDLMAGAVAARLARAGPRVGADGA